jgi:hypothetical protein
MRRVNGILTIFWIAMIPVSDTLGWLNSVAYVSALSLWALVAGHWSSGQAARVEVEQLTENPVKERVVDKLVERTEDDEPAHQKPARASTSSTGSTAKTVWNGIEWFVSSNRGSK